MESSNKPRSNLGKSVFDSRPLAEKVLNKKQLNKKIVKNSKYENIKSVVDHGKTMKDVQVISDQLIAKRKGENFGRIKSSTLAKFLNEINNEESIQGLMLQSENENTENKENWEVKSTTSSIMSVGKESVTSAVTCTTDMLGITSETKFILLDLRDTEDYKKFHIRESISFPYPNITRDKTFAQLLKFKNQPDKIIVVYMYDERSGTQYAKLLFEKGFDNVYLLSGGVEKFYENHPDLVEGNQLPEIPKKIVKSMGKTQKSVLSSTQTTFNSRATKK